MATSIPEDLKPYEVILQYFGYGNKLNKESEAYLSFCATKTWELMHIRSGFGRFFKDLVPSSLRRIFSGGVPAGCTGGISEAEFMIRWFESIQKFDPSIDFLDNTSKTTRDNVREAIPFIFKRVVACRGEGKIVRLYICCDLLRAPRIAWLYNKYSEGAIKVYGACGYPFHRTKWEVFREFVSFHLVEKTIYYLPRISELLEPIRRQTMFRNFNKNEVKP